MNVEILSSISATFGRLFHELGPATVNAHVAVVPLAFNVECLVFLFHDDCFHL